MDKETKEIQKQMMKNAKIKIVGGFFFVKISMVY